MEIKRGDEGREAIFLPKTPFLTTDGIIELYKDEAFQGIVLIERLNEPLGIAIPGGFVDIGESVEEAVVREMKEETDLDVEISYLLDIYSDPARDPRFHTASVVYVCKAEGVPKGLDDAKEAIVYKRENIPFDRLVFDHARILQDYLKKTLKTLS